MIDQITRGYLDAAVWADSPEGSKARFTRKALAHARAECARFLAACGDLADTAIRTPGYSAERFGHDFWLTRCGHGAGFWDRDELAAPGFESTGLDRDGKPYQCAGTLGDVLSALAYGGSQISEFSGQTLYTCRDWFYFSK